MERAERVVVLCAGLAFSFLLIPLLWLMLALTIATAVQRFVKVWRQANAAGHGPPPAERPVFVRRSGYARGEPAAVTARWRAWREANGWVPRSARYADGSHAQPSAAARWQERRQARLARLAGDQGTPEVAPSRPGVATDLAGPEAPGPSRRAQQPHHSSPTYGLPGRVAGGRRAPRTGRPGHRRRDGGADRPGAAPARPLRRRSRRRRELVARHLRRVYGPGLRGRQLVRRVDETFASYARYWADSLRLASLRPERDPGRHTLRGIRAHRGRRGSRAGYHPRPTAPRWVGVGRARLAISGHPMSVVVEALDPPEVFEWFVAFRERLGMEVIPTGPGAAAAAVEPWLTTICCACSATGWWGGRPVWKWTSSASAPCCRPGRSRWPCGPGRPVLPCAVYFGPSPASIGPRSGRLPFRPSTAGSAMTCKRGPSRWRSELEV